MNVDEISIAGASVLAPGEEGQDYLRPQNLKELLVSWSGWGTRVRPWWIHVDVWQNQYNIVK